MAKLAIRGHATRGSEVIELLEMLGGINKFNLRGNEDEWFVLNGTLIQRTDRLFAEKGFSLEEFLEKYPYKVGDKVVVTAGKDTFIDAIGEMKWEEKINTILYVPQNIKINVYPENLQPYKEETVEERKYKELRMALDDDDKLASEATIKGKKIVPPDGYLIGKITQVDNGMLIEYIEKKPQYPKTYVECAKILNCFGAAHIDGYKCELLEKFQELLICRDAYWKIAGEQMGLGKPWEPDWTNTNSNKHCIYYVGDEIKKQPMLEVHHFLAFPTAEMRDAFFENFNDLIEQYKALL